jgi:RNA polymerase sigma-70 factor (ECF subfamily)
MTATDQPSGPTPGKASGTSLTLIERARSRDEDAWGRLVSLYQPLVCAWCAAARVTGADADDVVQEVFRAALTSLPGFRKDRAGDTFRGWLRTITRRMIGRHSQRLHRQPRARGGTDAQIRLAEISEPLVDLPDEDPPEARQGLYRRALELVRTEFEEKTWQMFWRAVVEDQPPATVAAQFGVTPATVRKAKSRVLHRLKQEVGDAID